MSLTTLGITSLCLSVAVIIGALALCILLFVRYHKDDTENIHQLLSPLQVFTVCFFFAVVIMLYPINVILVGETGFWSVLKSILLSVQYALQVFTVNTGFDSVQSIMGSADVDQTLSMIYTVYASVLFVVSPALTASFILSLFKETSALLKYSLYPKTDIYLMSELNEKSITLARDIKRSSNIAGRRLIVFTGVNKSSDGNSELLIKANKLGAICLKREITRVGLKPTKRNIHRKFYLISEDEDVNIKQSLELIERLREKCDNDKTELYVFANSIESEALLDSVDIGRMKVRRVNENRNLVWQTLREVSIFDNPYIPEGSAEKQLNIVIVGCGNYGTELLKTICWLGQMPGYSLTIQVFDKEKDCKEKVKCIAPELISKSCIKQEGEANYIINFYPETDVESSEFIEKLNTIGHITSVFVTLGSDRVNIDNAIKIRVALLRDNKYSSLQPSIYPVVYSQSRTETAKKGKRLITAKDAENAPELIYNIGKYDLRFIGNITKCYSLENIEHSTLEKEAADYHLCWAYSSGNENQIQEDKLKFNKFEYYRSSSIAQAIYIEYLKKLKPIQEMIFLAENKLLFNEYEHRRWNAYMRAEGYVYSEKRDNLAKKHYDLKPFNELPETEKQKDEVWEVALSK